MNEEAGTTSDGAGSKPVGTEACRVIVMGEPVPVAGSFLWSG